MVLFHCMDVHCFIFPATDEHRAFRCYANMYEATIYILILILLCIRVSVSIRFPRWEGIVKAASCLLSKPCTDKCRVLLSGLFTTHSLPTGSFLTLLLGYFYKFGYDHGFPRLMAPHCQQDRVQTLGIHPGSFSGSLGPLGSRYQDGI